MSVDDEAPGWDAITARIESFHPGVHPVHQGTAGVVFGSSLDGVSAYRGQSWWHFVTYGLTELYQKVSQDSEWSGWGYELTMRTPLSDGPPEWAFGVLLSLASVTAKQGTVFGAGHRLQTGKALAGLPTRLTAVAFTLDPQLGAIDTPYGKVEFLLAVGITTDELERMKTSSTASVLAELDKSTSLMTDPSRAPLA